MIGLPFPPLGCSSVIFFVNVRCAVSCLHRRVQRPNSWCHVQILLPTMWSEILCSLSSLDFVTDGRNSIVTTSALIDGIKYYCHAFFLVTTSSQRLGSVNTLLLKGSYFLQANV